MTYNLTPNNSTGQEYCGDITLTINDGVTSDPSGLANLTTLQTNPGVKVWVTLTFDVITRVEVMETVSTDSCQMSDCCVQNVMSWTDVDGVTWGPDPGFGIINQNEVFVDMGCEARLRVCGISKCGFGKQAISLVDKPH